MSYISLMGTLTRTIKLVVTATVVVVTFSFAAVADSAKLDGLFADLKAATATNYAQIEEQIVAEWGKSGSAAVDLLMRRGEDALVAGNISAAVEHFTAAIDHAPDIANAYNGRASAYYLMGDVGPAIVDLRQALILDPRHFRALQGFAVLLEELGRPGDALEVYKQFLDLHPMADDVRAAVDRLERLDGQSL